MCSSCYCPQKALVFCGPCIKAANSPAYLAFTYGLFAYIQHIAESKHYKITREVERTQSLIL